MKRPLFKNRRQARNKQRKSTNRFSKIENLENRTLLTASGLAGLPMAGHIDGSQDMGPMPATAVFAEAVPREEKLVGGQEVIERIVNGTQTSDYDAVGIVNNGCSGTLIAPNAVLTAAHCIGGSQGTFEVNGRVYETERISVHPEYGSRDIDLAVMVLKENVVGIEPVEINRSVPKVGDMLTLVGFGATGTPQQGHNGSFGVKHVGQTPIDQVTDTGVNWNFDNASEANTAPGDSGGPAFLTINGQNVVAGVTSGGTQEDAGLGDFSFDTRVDVFASWIDGAIAGTNNDPEVPTGGGDDFGGDDFDGDQFEDQDPVELAIAELNDYDVNGNGMLSRGELENEFVEGGFSQSEARDEADYLIGEFDSDGNSQLDLGELVTSWGGDANDVADVDEVDPVDDIDETDDDFNDDDDFVDEGQDEDFGNGDELDPQSALGQAQAELDQYDANGNGMLSRNELVTEFLDFGYSQAEARGEADYLISEFDADGNRQLDLEELVVSWGGDVSDVDDFDDDFTDPVDENDDDLIDHNGDEQGEPIVAGDVDGNGVVNAADLNLLALGWSQEVGEDSPFDLNGDGLLSSADLNILALNWLSNA